MKTCKKAPVQILLGIFPEFNATRQNRLQPNYKEHPHLNMLLMVLECITTKIAALHVETLIRTIQKRKWANWKFLTREIKKKKCYNNMAHSPNNHIAYCLTRIKLVQAHLVTKNLAQFTRNRT